MIGELIRYWTTFAPERVRKFGYLKRLIALEFRHRRCAAAWEPHLRRTRSFITKAADLCPRHGIVVILGSGLLLDVPLKALADRFDRVYLVDMFHMPQVRREAKRYFNVKLLTGDVTGIFAMMNEGRAPGPNIPAPPPRIPHLKDADLIVSCNCMTQLAGPFNEHYEKTRGFSELDSDKLAYQVMEQHAKAIAVDAAGIGVLITDTARVAMQNDRIVSRTDLLKALRLPPTPRQLHNEEWDWRIAPAPEAHPSHDIEHLIDAKVYERNLPAEDGKTDGAAAKPPELEPDDTPIDNGDPLADVGR